jgi:hypothetical protein
MTVVNCLDVTACHSEERSDEESGVGLVHTSRDSSLRSE